MTFTEKILNFYLSRYTGVFSARLTALRISGDRFYPELERSMYIQPIVKDSREMVGSL